MHKGVYFQNHLMGYDFDCEKLSMFLRKQILKNNAQFLNTVKRLRSLCDSSTPPEVKQLKPDLTFKKSVDVDIDAYTIIKDEYSRVYLKSVGAEEIDRLLRSRFFPAEVIARFIKNNLIEKPVSIPGQDQSSLGAKMIIKTAPEVFGIHGSWFAPQRSVIKEIKRAGGIPTIGHPFLGHSMPEKETGETYEAFIQRLIQFGIEGIESYYYRGQGYTIQQEIYFNKKSLKIAQENDLVLTYGSDCHGPKRGNPSKNFLGKYGGNSIIPFASLHRNQG